MDIKKEFEREFNIHSQWKENKKKEKVLEKYDWRTP